MREYGTAAAPVPASVRTARLLLRRWEPGDAPRLLPVLDSNAGHLAPWIPAAVAGVVPVEDLARRLADFAARFDAGREWRFGVFEADSGDVLGEASLFPRGAVGRVPYPESDRAEIGYWLRADATGRGYATEAAAALLALAAALPRVSRVEIHVDARNRASAALPRRLGFRLESSVERPGACAADPPGVEETWVRENAPGEGSRPA